MLLPLLLFSSCGPPVHYLDAVRCQMKAALCADSRRLKNELEAAKQTLRTRMAARSSRQQAGDTPCSSSSDQQ